MPYEIRAMGFGEILDTGFRIVRNHFALLVGIQALYHVPIALVSALAFPTTRAPDPAIVIPAVVGVVIAALIVQPIILAASTHAVSESFRSRTVGMAAALRCGTSIFLPLVGTTFLAVLAMLAGFAVFVIPGVILVLAFLVLTPVMVVERSFGMAALTRSWDLMKGNLLRGLGLYVVAAMIFGVFVAGVGLFANFIPILGVLLTAISQAVAQAFLAATFVVLYFDIRCRKEAFDLEHLAERVESGMGMPAAPLA